ncbi:MAG: HEAT repeat domain-containing protein [Anaerolineales bacterium]
MPRIYFSNDKRTVDQLLIALSSKDWGVRRVAAHELGNRGDCSAVEPLIQALNDPSHSVCDEAILALGKLGDQKAIDALVLMFNKPSHAYYSARALSSIKSKRVTKPLISGLISKEVIIRRSSAEALGYVKDKKAIEYLIEALKDEDNIVRKYAAYSLGKYKDSKSIQPLLDILKNEAIKRENGTTPSYIDSFEEVQVACIFALGSIGDQNIDEHILEFLESDYRNLVYAAIYTLGEIQSQKALKPLLKLFDDDSTRKWCGHYIAVALGKIGDEKVFEPLIKALSEEDEVIRIAATDGLGYLGNSRAIPALKLARKNDTGIDEFGESVKEHATKAIHRIQKCSTINN